MTPATAELMALGATVQLAAEVRDQAGQAMAGATVTWASADTTVAAVDSAGLVTAAGRGTTTITATAGAASGEAVVRVMQSAGSVVVSPAADTVAPGDTLRLVAEAFDENGHAVEGAEFSWTSSNGSVATVDASGLVTGLAEGTATITAMAGEASGTSEITVENPDRAALVALYNATDGPNWVDNENWLSDRPLREWYGVHTDASGRVVRLHLSGRWDNDNREYVPHGLSGSIPPELGSLTNLVSLYLHENELTGPIPSELGSLSRLETLLLGGNQLTGPIPSELGSLTYLESLWLYGNELTGPIPSELGNLTNLESLFLRSNELTGPIPSELGSLAALQRIWLNYNELTGRIPVELGSLTRLEILALSGNALTGPIPAELGNLSNLESLGLSNNELTGRIPVELGSLTRLEDLTLSGNELTGPIPAELGSLTDLRHLFLSGNELTGPIPVELGSLTNLESLWLSGNKIAGPIPRHLLQLVNLTRLYFSRNDGLCAPGTAGFVAWLPGLEEADGPFCNEADMAALTALHERTAGERWTNSDGWLADAALGQWFGIEADSLGRVLTLDLTRNGLSGKLSQSLGDLAGMTVLRIGGNALSGRLPATLVHLTLSELDYAGTELCTPDEASFQAWLNGIPSHEGTAEECAPLTDREILEILYDVTGGPTWTNSRNWLTDAPLGEWHGVRVDDRGRVVELSFLANGLDGEIPAELGSLAELRRLHFARHRLTGPIPAQLGNLANLASLSLYRNALEGEIPPELGSLEALVQLRLHANELEGAIPPELSNLANLIELSLYDNELEHAIPAELGNLANLRRLFLSGNRLTGSIPPVLGDLANLQSLSLTSNELVGPLPAELGNLAALEELSVGHNVLTGSVPQEFGELTNARELAFSGNADMSGALPLSLTGLRSLETLETSGTQLCAPSDPRFVDWLDDIPNPRVPRCESASASAYLVQAVQSREFPVPLVAGERALLRVFPTARQPTSVGIPAIRARFHRNDREIHLVDIPGKSVPIPTEVDEGSLSKSANAEIPGHVIQPGLEMVMEVDPNGKLDPVLGVAERIPETGRLELEVRVLPRFELTVIPFLWSPKPDSVVLDIVTAMAEDSQEHELLGMTRRLLPIADFSLIAHEPVVTSHNNSYDLLRETEMLRVLEGERGYYMGTMTGEFRGIDGLANGIPGRAIFSRVDHGSRSEYVIAHELGHNMNLRHPLGCNAGGPDPSYPYASGRVGVWGYDADAQVLVPPSQADLMSYCPPLEWVSDYHFSKALRYRLADEGSASAATATALDRSLLLWGGVDSIGVPYLEPAFVVEAPRALPDSAGAHRLTGRSASGGELFSFSFAMPEVADGDGSSSFAFVLPVRAGWEGSLAAITLTGPGGSFTLDSESDFGMGILRNPRTGQVRGFLRDLPAPTQAAMDAAGVGAPPGLEVLFSRGIPDAAAWRR